jgi:hypothetical protein
MVLKEPWLLKGWVWKLGRFEGPEWATGTWIHWDTHRTGSQMVGCGPDFVGLRVLWVAEDT